MFRFRKYVFIIIILIIFCCFIIFNYIGLIYNKQINQFQNFSSFNKSQLIRQKDEYEDKDINIGKQNITDRIFISFVVCSLRLNESLNVVKSVLLFTSTPVCFVIFSEDILIPQLNYTLTNWKKIRPNLDFELHKIKFPKLHEQEWLHLFRKCAAQRLFLPELLPHIDSLIYVDIDTLFLGPADELWHYFSKFHSYQISAMALETEKTYLSWYFIHSQHPFYGKTGLNSGVMLMNLTRLRSFGWVNYVTTIMPKWKAHLPWGDQDIINIIFHYHERLLYLLSCRYNYRSDLCQYGDTCSSADRDGVYILHGSRSVFVDNLTRQPAFKAVYQAIDEYQLDMNPRTVLEKMERYLDEAPVTNCGRVKQSFLKLPKETIQNMYSKPDS